MSVWIWHGWTRPAMYLVLVLLLLGFAFDTASAFTNAYSRRWGKSRGQLASSLLRNVAGVPVWVVGVGFAMRAPSPLMFAPSAATTVGGWVLMLAGAVIQALAIVVLRGRAASPSVDDTLAAGGVYAHVRHPIYAGLLLQFPALLLVRPCQTVLLTAALGIAWVWLQAWCEERDLVERMPAYTEYMTRVPRFIPRLGRGR